MSTEYTLTQLRHTMKKRLLALALLFKGESAVAAAMGTTAGVAATATGHDPWPWIIGGFGAAVVYVKRPATSRQDAIINGAISVLLGGLVAPTLAQYLASHWDPVLANPYPVAFILSCVWPWMIPLVMEKLKTANLPEPTPPSSPTPVVPDQKDPQ